jgi:hypothetical protein
MTTRRAGFTLATLTIAASLSACSLYFGDDETNPSSGDGGGGITTPEDGGVSPGAVPIATFGPGIVAMTIADDFLYFADEGGENLQLATVSRMPLAGGTIDTFYSGASLVDSIAVLPGGFTFITHTDGATPTTGGEVIVIQDGSDEQDVVARTTNPTTVRSDGMFFYFNDSSSPGSISRAPVGTGGSAQTLVSNVNEPGDLAVGSDGTVYYTELGTARIMRVTPGSGAVEMSGGWDSVDKIVTDSTYVYFTATTHGLAGLYRERTTGASTTTTTALGLFSGNALAGAGIALAGSGTIQWGNALVPTTPGAAVSVFPFVGDARAVASTADASYAADYKTGAIYRGAH